MVNNPDLTEELIFTITGKRVCATTINQQEVRNPSIHSDGTRLPLGRLRCDVFMVTDRNAMYDIEMQRRPQRNLALRTRYYLGVNDVSILQKKDKRNEENHIQSYRDLPESNIIFICTFDPFHLKAEVYEARERLFIEDEETMMDLTAEGQYDAKHAKIYLNTSKDVEIHNASEEGLRNLIEYIRTGKTKDSFTEKIQAEVLLINRTDRGALMTYEQELKERELEGEEKGIKAKSRSIILNMLSKGMSAEQIADLTGEPMELVLSVINKA